MNGKRGGHAVQVKGPTVPRLKAPGFWSLPSTVFVLRQVWWQREETVRAAQERREPAHVGLSVCEAMTLLNCSYGELRRRLQAVPRADRRRSKSTLILRERLRRMEEQEARQQALAVTRLRGLTGVGIRVVEGLTKPGPEDSDGPGTFPWEEE